MPLPWQQLHSSVLVRATWDPDTEQLQIQFSSGRVYTFTDVPVSVYQGLLEADSPGRFFNEQIKGNYG